MRAGELDTTKAGVTCVSLPQAQLCGSLCCAVPGGAVWAELKLLEPVGCLMAVLLLASITGCAPPPPPPPQSYMLRATALPRFVPSHPLPNSCAAFCTRPHLQTYMLRATALLPHTRYSDSEWRSFTQLSAHQVRSFYLNAWLACKAH